jgi:hypothetical protein
MGDTKVNGKFKYCTSSINSQLVINSNNCSTEKINNNQIEKEVSILEEMTYQIYGDAYTCKKIRIEAVYRWNWYFTSSKSVEQITEDVSKDECKNMVESRQCEKMNMTCGDSHCSLDVKPNPYFAYAKTLKFFGYICEINKVLLYSNNYNKKVFSDATSACLPADLYCKTKDLTIIWDESILHDCPYQFIKQLKLNISDNIWSSDDERLVFQSTKRSLKCNITMFETTEGFYLTTDKLPKLTKSDRELKTLHHLILADSDYKELVNMKRISKINKQISENQCRAIKMIINIYNKLHNKYLIVQDANGNEIVLFNNDGLILVAECLNVNNITIKSKMSECLIQPEIELNLFNKIQVLSLFDDNIVSYNKDIQQDCRKRKITLIDKNRIVVTVNATNELIEVDNRVIDIFNGKVESERINLAHSSLFKEEFDPISQIEKMTKLKEINGHYYIMPELATYGTEIKQNTVDWMKTILAHYNLYIIMFILCVLCTIIIVNVIKLYNCFSICNKLIYRKSSKLPVISFDSAAQACSITSNITEKRETKLLDIAEPVMSTQIIESSIISDANAHELKTALLNKIAKETEALANSV